MILTKKNILIVGAAGFLGKFISKACHDKGANCILVDKNYSKLQKTYKKYSTRKSIFKCDIKSIDDIQNLKIFLKTKKIHGLVNAISDGDKVGKKNDKTFKTFLDTNKEDLEDQLNLNVVSIVLLYKNLIPNLLKAKKSSVINIGSDLSMISPYHKLYTNKKNNFSTKAISYSIAKHGMIGVIKFLATYYASQNIRFNSVSPGAINNNQNQKFKNKINKLIPMNRMGNSKELTGIITHLLSDESTYTTGTNILIDGGRSIW